MNDIRVLDYFPYYDVWRDGVKIDSMYANWGPPLTYSQIRDIEAGYTEAYEGE